jgi:hypothetical protein
VRFRLSSETETQRDHGSKGAESPEESGDARCCSPDRQVFDANAKAEAPLDGKPSSETDKREGTNR